MPIPSAPVKSGDTQFDLYQVGGWIDGHPWLAVVAVIVCYVFWISRRDGLAGVIFEYLGKRLDVDRGLKADRETLKQRFEDRAGRTRPLPFDDDDGNQAENGREK